MPVPSPAPSKAAASSAQKALLKLGLTRDIDLALHLPLRYEDETRITPLRNARDGSVVQIEATVVSSEVQLRPRRQLVVQVEDDTGSCELRFFSFYPSHQKTLSVGARLRIRGEIKGGFWGRQMMHPAFRTAGGELPAALTPVYPTVAGLPQPYLRRAIASALQRADLSDTLPPNAAPPVHQTFGAGGLQPLYSLQQALRFLHNPTPDVALATLEDHTHPASAPHGVRPAAETGRASAVRIRVPTPARQCRWRGRQSAAWPRRTGVRPGTRRVRGFQDRGARSRSRRWFRPWHAGGRARFRRACRCRPRHTAAHRPRPPRPGPRARAAGAAGSARSARNARSPSARHWARRRRPR